jgi:hypothetical protein
MMAVASHAPALTFADRLRQARSRSVVVHTSSGRSYAGRLMDADEVSVRLEGDSDEYDAPCLLEIDAARVEAIEIIKP